MDRKTHFQQPIKPNPVPLVNRVLGHTHTIASHPAAMSECTIEFESAIGSKMRIQWKGSAAPDWTSLLRAWREAER